MFKERERLEESLEFFREMGMCCSGLSGDVAGGKQGVGGAPQRPITGQNNHGHNDAVDFFFRSRGLQALFTQIEVHVIIIINMEAVFFLFLF